MGLFGPDDGIEITVPAHGVRILRLTPWDGAGPRILGTDFHMTGGACEIVGRTISPARIEGIVETQWTYPLVVTAGFPDGRDGIVVAKDTVPATQTRFNIFP